MKGLALRGAVLLAGLVASGVQAQPETLPVHDAAIIAMSEPDLHLGRMIADTVFKTNTGQMALQTFGHSNFCAALNPLIAKAVAKHRDAWTSNLVSAWRATVPADALAAAAVLPAPGGALSLKAYAEPIGTTMQVSSKELLVGAANDALLPLATAAMKIERKSVNMAARLKELVASYQDGSFGCGWFSGAAGATGGATVSTSRSDASAIQE